MTITVNGAAWEVEADTTVAQLLESATGSTRGSAVVIDAAVLPRAEWSTYRLRPGQTIELITAVQGG